MTTPSQPRWPNPGSDGRLKEKHLPAHLGQSNLNATYVPTSGAEVVPVTTPLRFGAMPAMRAESGAGIPGKPSTDTSSALWNIEHDSPTGYLMHLTTQPNSGSGAAVIALGGEYGNADLLFSNAKAGGSAIRAVSHPSATAHTVQIENHSRTRRPLSVVMRVGSAPMTFLLGKGEGFADGTLTNGSTTITSATANFTAGDVGSPIVQTTPRNEGFCIPSGTTIASVTNATTAVLSKAATGTGSAINFSISNRTPTTSQQWATFYDSSDVLRFEMSPSILRTHGINWEARTTNATGARTMLVPGNVRNYVYDTGASQYVAHRLNADVQYQSLTSYAAAAPGAESAGFDGIRVGFNKVGFFNAAPVAKPTGVAVTAEAIHAALVTLGLIAA
ncbi:hypothetical protein [Rhodococcus ruber]|uniref:hypothetical protein n=1 Tax=Rhodococcus ruber TaxID=1830 RepID=UPI003D816A79